MITGEIKNKIDNLWDAMWSNQMTNPWIDIQQITYLIFIKMLDDQQIKTERKINSLVAAGMKVNLDEYNLIFKEISDTESIIRELRIIENDILKILKKRNEK